MTAMTPVTASLLPRFEMVRAATMSLVETLTDEDCTPQSMTEASPVKWHLAHTTWFFETFVLEALEPNFEPFDPDFRVLFNSYYNQVGAQHLRHQRGLLTRPSLSQVEDYRQNVDGRISALLLIADSAGAEPDLELHRRIELGLQHEQQHQELILTDVQHLFSLNPIKPAFYSTPRTPHEPAQPLEWRKFEEGVTHIGAHADDFCFDNELPRHRHFLEPFSLANRLVTNGEYLRFVESGGYRDPTLWLSDGWAWLNQGTEPLAHPLYWSKEGDQWLEFGLHGLSPLDEHAPALHLSYYEADAYARWADARLPTEFEWEHAVRSQSGWAPAEQPPGIPRLIQLFDTAWQWTTSAYAPYPKYQPEKGALGEYNGKFMVNQYVLRGGSLATPLGHSRPSYRNFFPAGTRWQFSGIRLAR